MNRYPASQVLKETLSEWESAEVAAYKLACSLGIVPPEDGSFDGYRDAKALFGAASELGDILCQALDSLTAAGVLEFDPERIKYRWNRGFKGFWE
jgi:hypothetical protein